jgi:hypothetical protein
MKKEYVIGYCTKELDILDNVDNRRYFRVSAHSYEAAERKLKKEVPSVNFHELIKINS